MPKVKKAGLVPISTDKGATMALEAWCRKQRFRQNVDALKAATKDAFAAFSNQSLSKKMGIIFDSMFGKGSMNGNDHDDLPVSKTDQLIASARNNAGIFEDDDAKPTSISPMPGGLPMALSIAQQGPPPLYANHENKYEPWIDIFHYTHDVEGEGPIDYVGVSMGADGMRDAKATVVDDGMMLQIISSIPSCRCNIDGPYESRQEAYMEIAGDKTRPKNEKKEAKRKYDQLAARRTAQSKALRGMKLEKGANWSMQVTRVPLDVAVEKTIVSFKIHEDDDGKSLHVDLKVIQDDTHVDALAASKASPAKPS